MVESRLLRMQRGCRAALLSVQCMNCAASLRIAPRDVCDGLEAEERR